MSRFANPQATKRFVLGDCECPGKPHDEDFLDIRSELSGLDLARIEGASPVERMKLLVIGWNLIGDDGSVAPLDDDYLSRLYLDTFSALNTWLTENAQTSTLPNGLGAHSRNGSRASASRPIPTTPEK